MTQHRHARHLEQSVVPFDEWTLARRCFGNLQHALADLFTQRCQLRLIFGRRGLARQRLLKQSIRFARRGDTQHVGIVGVPVGMLDIEQNRAIDQLGVLEDRLQPEVVLLAERIELVIVTSRTTDRQSEKRRSSRIDPIGEFLVPPQLRVESRFANPRPQPEQARAELSLHVCDLPGGQRIAAAPFHVARPDFIGGELLLHEAVIRLVVIEGFDHPIAISPSVAVILFGLKPGRVRVPCDI